MKNVARQTVDLFLQPSLWSEENPGRPTKFKNYGTGTHFKLKTAVPNKSFHVTLLRGREREILHFYITIGPFFQFLLATSLASPKYYPRHQEK